MTEELQSHFELPPFIPIFIGLDEHLRLGKMSLTDLGVYLLLHRWCEWRWGIYYGCAATIASLMGGRAEKSEVQRSLQNLRRFEFINYRQGSGSRGSYNILIHKYLPRVGELRGYRLNAFAINCLDQPLYECPNSQRTVDGLSTDGGRTVQRLRTNGERTEDEPLQEDQEYKSIRITDFKSPKVGRLVGGRSLRLHRPPHHLSLTFRMTRRETLSRLKLSIFLTPLLDRVRSFPFQLSP